MGDRALNSVSRIHLVMNASPGENASAGRPTSTVQSNIQSVAELERAFEEARTPVDRIADAIGDFSGSMAFVALHAVWFIAWFLINTGLIPHVPRFDPYPFILLAMIVSVEGVLLSTFVLMKQNRMQRKADLRNHLDLQINLLSEKEVTKSLQLLQVICTKLEIAGVQPDSELADMANTTSVDILAKEIQTEISSE